MADPTFDWLIANPWVMSEYAFRWIAVGAEGVVGEAERIDELIAQVDGAAAQGEVRYTFAYAPRELPG